MGENMRRSNKHSRIRREYLENRRVDRTKPNRFIVKEEFHSFHGAMWYRIHDTENNISCPWYPSRRKAVAEALKLNRADISAKKIEAAEKIRRDFRSIPPRPQ